MKEWYSSNYDWIVAFVASVSIVAVVLLGTDALVSDHSAEMPINLGPSDRVSIPRHVARAEAEALLRANLVGDPKGQKIWVGAEKYIKAVDEPALCLMFKRFARATAASPMTVEVEYSYGLYPIEVGEWENSFLWDGLERMASEMTTKEMTTALCKGDEPVITPVEGEEDDRLRITGYPARYVTKGISRDAIAKIVAGVKAAVTLHSCLYPGQLPPVPEKCFRGASEAAITRFAREKWEYMLSHECQPWRIDEYLSGDVRSDLFRLAEETHSCPPDDPAFRKRARGLLCEIVRTDYGAERKELGDRVRLGYRTWVWGAAEEAKRRARGEKPRLIPICN